MTENTSIRLRRIMDERNLKQSDILRLAEPFCEKYKIKLGKSDLSQFVSGKVEPGQWKLTILGLALNVSEGWLMGLDVPMQREVEPTPLSFPGSSTIHLTPLEKEIIVAYRHADELDRRLVLRTLKIDVEERKTAIPGVG